MNWYQRLKLWRGMKCILSTSSNTYFTAKFRGRIRAMARYNAHIAKKALMYLDLQFGLTKSYCTLHPVLVACHAELHGFAYWRLYKKAPSNKNSGANYSANYRGLSPTIEVIRLKRKAGSNWNCLHIGSRQHHWYLLNLPMTFSFCMEIFIG